MATKRKTRKFGEGGMLQDVSVDESIDKKPDVAITRGDAFKAARKAGKKTFWYGGNEYTTEMAPTRKGPTLPTGKMSRDEIDSATNKEPNVSIKVTPEKKFDKSNEGKINSDRFATAMAPGLYKDRAEGEKRKKFAAAMAPGVSAGMKKGGKVKKYAAGGDIAPMSAMPSGKQLKENIEAQKQSEAERQARYKAVKADAAAASPANKKASGGTIKKYARGGGIESKGKTRGKIC